MPVAADRITLEIGRIRITVPESDQRTSVGHGDTCIVIVGAEQPAQILVVTVIEEHEGERMGVTLLLGERSKL